MSLLDHLKAYRRAMLLSQEELARRAGINDKYYGRVERGESSPTIDCLYKICSSLEMTPAEFFLVEVSSRKDRSTIPPSFAKCIIHGLQNDIDVHFNRDAIFDDCENCIWYNGYVGSMCFDEFELTLFAIGNIRGDLYLDGNLILQLNGEDISSELRKYICSDKQLFQITEYMGFDEDVLKTKNGNALFLQESNWLTANIINHQTGEILFSDIVLDGDNVINALSNYTLLFDLVFMKGRDPIIQGDTTNG